MILHLYPKRYNSLYTNPFVLTHIVKIKFVINLIILILNVNSNYIRKLYFNNNH